MTGAGEGQSVIGGIDGAVAEGDESIGSDVVGYHFVQLPYESAGRNRFGRECSEAGLQVGHQQRRANSFTGDVTDADADLFLAELEDIKIISANDARGLPRSRHFQSPDLGNLFGQETLLNLPGLVEIQVLALRSGVSHLDGALKFEILALKARLRFGI